MSIYKTVAQNQNYSSAGMPLDAAAKYKDIYTPSRDPELYSDDESVKK